MGLASSKPVVVPVAKMSTLRSACVPTAPINIRNYLECFESEKLLGNQKDKEYLCSMEMKDTRAPKQKKPCYCASKPKDSGVGGKESDKQKKKPSPKDKDDHSSEQKAQENIRKPCLPSNPKNKLN